MDAVPEALSGIHAGEPKKTSWEINLIDGKGFSLDRSDISTINVFENIAEKNL
jgi:hypothetical protein